jgi:hypothetical protein
MGNYKSWNCCYTAGAPLPNSKPSLSPGFAECLCSAQGCYHASDHFYSKLFQIYNDVLVYANILSVYKLWRQPRFKRIGNKERKIRNEKVGQRCPVRRFKSVRPICFEMSDGNHQKGMRKLNF